MRRDAFQVRFAGVKKHSVPHRLTRHVAKPDTARRIGQHGTLCFRVPHAAYMETYPRSEFRTIVAFTDVKGDLNGDGKVDIADAVCVLDVMAKQ